MIDFSNVKFVLSTPNISSRPTTGLKEVLIVGKSNVGKSSLINALTSRKNLAFTSSKPGRTRLLNYFEIDNKFFLVDAPGYGYAKGGIDLDYLFKEMMDSYFNNNDKISLVLLLVDARREFNTNDLEILEFLKSENIPYYIVITKIDKTNQKERAQLRKHLITLGIESNITFLTSSNNKKSIINLQRGIEKVL